ncbi:hypothetical protein BOTBODRAFT_120339, partial [Botryobasidium botryosum FD-172 SS1]
GEVHLVKERDSGRQFALKTINITDRATGRVIDYYEKELAMEEIHILDSLDHPRIIALHDSYYIRMDKFVYLALELARGGSIQSFVERRRTSLREKHIARILTEVLEGFVYLHERGVIHRDIKPANLLLTADGHVKIADFGLACILASPTSKSTEECGTRDYKAPEMIRHRPYGVEVDIYSLGVTTEWLRNQVVGRVGSPELEEFIELCKISTFGGMKRPTAAQLLKVSFSTQ